MQSNLIHKFLFYRKLTKIWLNTVFNFKYLLKKILRLKFFLHLIASLEATAEKKRKVEDAGEKMNEIKKFTLFIRI